MGKSKRRERTAVERLAEVERATTGETREREEPIQSELIPPPPTLKSVKEAGHYMLGTVSDMLCYLSGPYEGVKPVPSDNLLWDLYAAVQVIGRCLAEGWHPPIADNRKANIAEIATLSFDGLNRHEHDEDHEAFLFVRSLKEATRKDGFQAAKKELARVGVVARV
jgi:hypothetical protein